MGLYGIHTKKLVSFKNLQDLASKKGDCHFTTDSHLGIFQSPSYPYRGTHRGILFLTRYKRGL